MSRGDSAERAPQGIDAQKRYADWLGYASTVGVAAILLAFLLYVGGVLDPLVPIEALPTLWGQSSGALMAEAGLSPGLDWLAHAGRADMMSLLAIGLLAASSVVALAAVIPVYLRQGKRLFAGICALEILVMVVAASGILSTGGH